MTIQVSLFLSSQYLDRTFFSYYYAPSSSLSYYFPSSNLRAFSSIQFLVDFFHTSQTHFWNTIIIHESICLYAILYAIYTATKLAFTTKSLSTYIILISLNKFHSRQITQMSMFYFIFPFNCSFAFISYRMTTFHLGLFGRWFDYPHWSC